MARKSTGIRLRFSIFERDNFTCQYCGQKPPQIVLNVDHIVPVAKGGGNERENLITACFECNSGKTDKVLSSGKTMVVVEDLKEKYQQLKAFYTWQKKIVEAKKHQEDYVCDYWEMLAGNSLTEKGRSSMRLFLDSHTADIITKAIDISMSKDRLDTFKYFCAILHNWKNGKKF